MTTSKYGPGYAGKLVLPYRKIRGWRYWWLGLRDAIEQRGIIGYGRTYDDWKACEDYDSGLCVGEFIARRCVGLPTHDLAEHIAILILAISVTLGIGIIGIMASQ